MQIYSAHPPRRWRRYLGVAAVLLTLHIGGTAQRLSFGLVPAADAADATHTAASTLFAAQLPDAGGTLRYLAAYSGRPLVVNFWASWCGPCVEEMPALSVLNSEYAHRGIAFVGIGVDNATNITAFLRNVKVDYPIFVAGYGGADLARNFGDSVGALPYTVVLDAYGRVRYTKLGRVNVDELRGILAAL